MMKKCELCDSPAKMYCDSDRASLCWDCDARVHSANFLVAKHSRSLLCRVCQSLTPWSGSGPKLSPTVSVCPNCVNSCYQNDTIIQQNDDEEEEEDDDDDLEDDSEEDNDEDNSDGGGRDDDDDEENQVVPWANNPPPPVPSSSSSSAESSTKSNGLFSSQGKLSESETTFFWKRSFSKAGFS